MDPLAVSREAGTVLTVSQHVTLAWQDAGVAVSTIASNVAGDTPSAPSLVASALACATAAASAMEALGGTLEYAADNLESCARGYSAVDEETAESLRIV